MNTKQDALNAASSLASNYAYYDRKGDEDLDYMSLEKMIRSGELTIEEIGKAFMDELRSEYRL